jgi:AraC-like DNA-binding protein
MKRPEWVEDLRTLPGGGSIWSRGRQWKLADGLWWLEQHLRCRGPQAGPFAMGAGWIVEFIELKRGRFELARNGQPLVVPWRRFVWILPAFSVVHLNSHDADFRFVAVAGEDRGAGMPAAASAATGSRIFPLRGALPRDAAESLRLLETLDDGLLAEISAGFPVIVRRAKRWIDRNYRARVSIAALARSLGVSHAHLSREFRRAVGMSPLQYVHHLRTSEALTRLSSGEPIADASLDVGYNDLGRFYKQFRRLGCSAPGRYRLPRR